MNENKTTPENFYRQKEDKQMGILERLAKCQEYVQELAIKLGVMDLQPLWDSTWEQADRPVEFMPNLPNGITRVC